MEDNIIFSKVWEDDCLIELRVTCTSSAASVISNIYVSDDSINELICKIRQFLCSKDNDETSSWTSIGSEDGSVACVSLRFLKKDTLGHIAVEVFAEIDDGGSRGTMTNESGGVYTFRAAGTAFSNVRQTFQSGIWD